MDKDTIIVAVLGIAFLGIVFVLFMAFAVTGYFYFAGSSDSNQKNLDSVEPVIDGLDLNVANDKNASDKNASDSNSDAANAAAAPPPEPPAPVCGNNVVEQGELCEKDADCDSAEKICSACKCIDKPKPKTPKLDSISLDSVVFECRSFNEKRGLAAKIFTLKNNGTADFTYSSPIDINAVVGETNDVVKTNAGYGVAVKPGKTFDIYPKDIDRSSAPYLFLGNTANLPMKITFGFGATGYVEYNAQLTFMNFKDVGCE